MIEMNLWGFLTLLLLFAVAFWVVVGIGYVIRQAFHRRKGAKP